MSKRLAEAAMKGKIGKQLINDLQRTGKACHVTDTDLAGFSVRMLPSGIGTYSLIYRNKSGRRLRYTIGSTKHWTPRQARDKAEEIRSRVNLGEDPCEEEANTGEVSLRKFLQEDYLPWMKTHRKTGALQVGRIISGFPALLNKQLDEITAWVVEKERTKRLKEGKVKPATINKDVAALKSALSRAVEWKKLKENPLTSVKALREEGGAKVRYLEPHEEEALLIALDGREDDMRKARKSANLWRRERQRTELMDLDMLPFVDHLKPMVLLSMHTGIRRGELFGLEWSDIDLNRAMLTVRGSIAKTSKTRHIPLNPFILDVMRQWKSQTQGEGFVFESPKGGRFDNIKRVWQNLLKRAEIKDFRWHDLRHHFASKLVQKGVDLYVVKELLGHASVVMTERHYAHLAPQAKVDAVAKLVQQIEEAKQPEKDKESHAEAEEATSA